MVVLAPLLEEFFFRGILFTRWSVKWGKVRGILLSSFLFGLLHADIIGAFVFGIVMCVLYIRTNTLWVPIVVHGLNNLVAASLGALGTIYGWSSDTDLQDLQTGLYVALCCMVIASPFVFGLVGRWWPTREDRLPYLTNRSYVLQKT